MGSVVSGLFGSDGSDAARDAGRIQSEATDRAIEEQRRQFNITQGNLDPFRQAATPALAQFMALLGLGGSEGTQGGGLSESQIRSNLLGSGQFNTPGTGGIINDEAGQFIGLRGPGSDSPLVKQQVLTAWDKFKADAQRQGQPALINDFLNKPSGFMPAEQLREHLFVGSGGGRGGLDQAGLDQEVARQLAAQGQGVPGQSAGDAQQAAIDAILEGPGQRFLRGRQQRGLLSGAAATGGLGGGNVLKALQTQAFGNAATDLQNQFGRLGTLISGGQNAAANLGQFGAQNASNIGNLLQSGAQATASGILGAQQAQAQQGQNLSGLIGAGLGAFF